MGSCPEVAEHVRQEAILASVLLEKPMTAKPKPAKKRTVTLVEGKVLRSLWVRRVRDFYVLDFGKPGGTRGCRPASDVEVRLIRALQAVPLPSRGTR
jgi:hypothetical protein